MFEVSTSTVLDRKERQRKSKEKRLKQKTLCRNGSICQEDRKKNVAEASNWNKINENTTKKRTCRRIQTEMSDNKKFSNVRDERGIP